MPPHTALAPWLFTAAGIALDPAAAAPLDGRAVAERMIAHYARAGGLEVSIHVYRAAGGQSGMSLGRAVFGEPSQMLWEFVKPRGYVRVSDGATYWVYDAGTRRYACAKVPEGGGYSPLFLFTGARRWLSGYSVMLDTEDTPAPDGVLSLRLVSKGRGTAGGVTLWVDARTYAVRRLRWDSSVVGVQSWLEVYERRAGFHPGNEVFHFAAPLGARAERPRGYTGPC